MLKNNKVKVAVSLLLLSTVLFAQDKFESKYTSIALKKCKQFSSDEMEGDDEMAGAWHCESYDNIAVDVEAGDIRESITLIRKGTAYPLEFWHIFSGFSSLGKLIEWRYKKGEPKKPQALIARYNVAGEDPEKSTSYLLVSKITDKQICVVGNIPPKKNQNKLARKMADKATTMPCVLKEQNINLKDKNVKQNILFGYE